MVQDQPLDHRQCCESESSGYKDTGTDPKAKVNVKKAFEHIA